jgi:predicted transcriptional regulator
MSSRQPPRQQLSPLEARIMRLAWRDGEVTAEAVTRAIGRLTNASVRTLLRRIESKGFLHHRVEGRTFVYTPRVDARTAARGVLQRVVNRFYGGSVEDLVQGLVDGRMIDRRALERLAARVSAAERGRRGGDGNE